MTFHLTLLWRLVLLVVLVTGLSLFSFSALTFHRLNKGVIAQETAVAQLAHERLSEQLRLQSRLISSEFLRIQTEMKRDLAGIAASSEVINAIGTGNIVAIDQALKKAASMSGLSSLIAMDGDLRSIGSHKPGLPVLAANIAFSRSSISKKAKEFFASADPESDESLIEFSAVDPSYSAALGFSNIENSKLTLASLTAVLDDFGDPIGLLVAHRQIRPDNTSIQTLVEQEHMGVRVIDHDEILFSSGSDIGSDTRSMSSPLLKMTKTDSGSHLLQCNVFRQGWRMCVYQPAEELEGLTSKLVQFIRDEKTSLLSWLVVFTGISSLLALLIAFMATKRVIAPLYQIRDAVRSVARGNWLAHVSGQRRKDEVGEIARAVVVLQRSMKERERLKADVADIDDVRGERQRLEEATVNCAHALRKQVFSISEFGDGIMEESKRLSSNVGLAEGETDEARLVVLRALKNVSLKQSDDAENELGSDAIGSIDRLAETISIINSETIELNETVNKLGPEIGLLDRVIKEFADRISLADKQISDPAKVDG